MYNTLRKNLKIDKRRLSHVWAIFNDIGALRYDPMSAKLPGYDPMIATLDEAEQKVLYDSPDEDADSTYGMFMKGLDRLDNLHSHTHALIAFDYAYGYEEYPRLIPELENVKTLFEGLAAGMAAVRKEWKDDWECLVSQGVITPKHYNKSMEAYEDILAGQHDLTHAEFEECRPHETAALMRRNFNLFASNELNMRCEFLTLGIERSEMLLERMLYILKCADDGILEHKVEDFWPTFREARDSLSLSLPELTHEFLYLSETVNAPAKKPAADVFMQFSQLQP